MNGMIGSTEVRWGKFFLSAVALVVISCTGFADSQTMASETCNTGFFFDVTLKLCLPCDPLCLGTAGQRHRGCSVCFASPTEAATTVQATTATSPTEQITDDSSEVKSSSSSFPLDTPVMIAVCLSLALVVVIIVLTVCFIRQHRRKQRQSQYGRKTAATINQQGQVSTRPKSNEYAHLWATENSPVPERRPLSGQYSVPRPQQNGDQASRPNAPTPLGQQQPQYAVLRPGNKAWLHQAIGQPQSKTSTLQSEIIEVCEQEEQRQPQNTPATITLPFHRLRSISAENLPQLASDNQRRRQNWFDEERCAYPNPRQASQLARQLTIPGYVTAPTVPGKASAPSAVVVRHHQPTRAAPLRPWSMNAQALGVESGRPLSDAGDSCRSTSTNSSTCAYSTGSAGSRMPNRNSTGLTLTSTAMQHNVYGDTGYDSFADDYYSDEQLA